MVTLIYYVILYYDKFLNYPSLENQDGQDMATKVHFCRRKSYKKCR